jgi:hypothetical protein
MSRYAAIVLAAMIAPATLLPLPAIAHDWYDRNCCSDRDCEPLPPEAVEDMADGWHINYISARGFRVKFVLPHGKERHSHDGQFHGCAAPTNFYCLYVPSNV